MHFCILRMNRISIKWTSIRNEHKIQQVSNFIVNNDSHLFFDAQEAYKVSERTIV